MVYSSFSSFYDSKKQLFTSGDLGVPKGRGLGQRKVQDVAWFCGAQALGRVSVGARVGR